MRDLRDRSILGRLLVLLLALSLVAAACGGDDDDDGATDDTPEDTADDEGQRGGEIVIAAEQWPECLNPITSCANASWMHWAVTGHVLPRAMELSPENEFVPSPVLDGEPELQEDPFTITYNIHEDAVWDDGTPITSADFEFTWQAYLNTPGSLSTSGYDLIESIDTSDDKVAVVAFSEPYADWWDLWGGNQQYILKADAFEGETVENDMLQEYTFSGGPWVLESFSPEEAVLVRNENYWHEDRVTMLDRVTVVPRTDTATEVNALLAGEVAAIYPQPAPGITDQLDQANIDTDIGGGVIFEGLWYNQVPPLDNKAVREALSYAVDRQDIVDSVMSEVVEGIEVLNCGGWVPSVGEWCDNTDFADITYDPDRAKEILEADGWALGSDGIYAKDGQKLEIPWATVSGNARREDTQQLVQQHARAAGISLTFDNSDAGELFENRLPQRNFVMAEYAQVTSPDPSVTSIYACDQIPSEENDFSGQNYLGWCNEEADGLTRESDRTIDIDERLELIHQIGDLVREDVVWLPLYQLPNIIAWDTDQIGGPISEYKNGVYSAFTNLYDWYLAS